MRCPDCDDKIPYFRSRVSLKYGGWRCRKCGSRIHADPFDIRPGNRRTTVLSIAVVLVFVLKVTIFDDAPEWLLAGLIFMLIVSDSVMQEITIIRSSLTTKLDPNIRRGRMRQASGKRIGIIAVASLILSLAHESLPDWLATTAILLCALSLPAAVILYFSGLRTQTLTLARIKRGLES